MSVDIVVDARTEIQAAAWIIHAEELTRKTARIIARTDAYPKWRPELPCDNKWRCVHDDLTADILADHYRGNITIGRYSLDREGMARTIDTDIDKHLDGSGDAAANLQFALQLYETLVGLGAFPLLTTSNGKGGYHCEVWMETPMDGTMARSISKWLVKDAPAVVEVEAFPKQGSDDRGKYGNQLRLVGKHHWRDHWSEVWNGSEWLKGEEAVRFVLAWRPTDPAVFPAEAKEYVPPKAPPTLPKQPATGNDDGSGEEWWKQYDGNLRTLDILKLTTGTECCDSDRGYWHEITCPWASEHTTGDNAGVFVPTDGGFPGFNCYHHHCKGRGLRELLEFYGRAKVDACCEERFGKETPDGSAVEAICTGGDGMAALTAGNSSETAEKTAEKTAEPAKKKEEEKEKRMPRRRAWTLEEWERQPGVEWYIEDILPKDSIVFLVGPSGHGKSFVALDMGLCVATGTDWLQYRKTRKGNVFYAVAEGQAGLKKRYRAWSQFHKKPYPQNFRLLPNPYWIQRPEEVAELRHSITDTGLNPDLIVIDTFNQMFMGNEKEGSDVRGFVASLNQLRMEFGCTIMVLHHTGWSENRRERGHSSLRGDADVTWVCYKPGGDDAPVTDGIIMENPKMKDAENHPPIMVCLKTVGEGKETAPVPTAIRAYGELMKRQEEEAEVKRLLPVLKRLSQTDPKTAESIAPVFNQQTGKDLTEKTVKNYLTAAARQGLVIQGGKGAKNDPYLYVLTEAGSRASS